jgi:uncharacterized membrane protein YfcA
LIADSNLSTRLFPSSFCVQLLPFVQWYIPLLIRFNQIGKSKALSDVRDNTPCQGVKVDQNMMHDFNLMIRLMTISKQFHFTIPTRRPIIRIEAIPLLKNTGAFSVTFRLLERIVAFMYFPVAGIEASPLLPPLAAFAVSALTSMGGVSGAFLLLPFQVSVLGYTSPSVSATNQFFNIVATPGGVWRYGKEGRLLAPLAKLTILASLPGVAVGAFIRLHWLSSLGPFKIFASLVLLSLVWRMVNDLLQVRAGQQPPKDARPVILENTVRQVRFTFQEKEYHYRIKPVFALTSVIGIIGGIYGIGGGSILAPFLVALYGLPIHVTAGATLLCTLVTSVGGVLAYTLLAPLYPGAGPDWLLGTLLGLGGLAGISLGARLQKYAPARIINILLTLCITGTALSWLIPQCMAWLR